MRNDMRPELSQKNPYWIGKHRYYELKHFCLQYPIWKKARLALDGLSRRPADLQVFVSCGQMKGDPTERCAQSRIFFGERMEMVEQAAIEAEPDLYSYLLRGVTEGLSYDALKMKYDSINRHGYKPSFPKNNSSFYEYSTTALRPQETSNAGYARITSAIMEPILIFERRKSIWQRLKRCWMM